MCWHKALLSDSVTSAGGFGPTDVFCAKAKRQRHDVFCAKAKRQRHDVFCAKAKRQRHDVGHSVIATGRGVLRLSSSISVDVFGHPLKNDFKPHSSHHL
ncbi:hypothetical protein [Lysinibacillus xylanilyticus]|uniref:hypothetical protein n=1 Tax=Lysinibacillus xylanilyticus TaxID=582475 RepID=UPI00382C4DCA